MAITAGNSVNQFREQLRSEVDALRSSKGQPESEQGRGYAFQYWLAELFSRMDRGLDTDSDDAVLLHAEGGIDILMQDSTRKSAYLIQAKWQSQKAIIDSEFAASFFGKHSCLMDKSWVRRLKSIRARDVLSSYREMIEDGFSMRYIYISTGRNPENADTAARKRQAEYQAQNLNISCEVWDFYRIKEAFDRAEKQERQVPEEVVFKLQTGNFLELEGGPLPMLIGAIAGNELKNLFKTKGDALFAYNIRQFLGSRGINRDISATADSDPDHFLYFNNGITAICTSYQLEENTVAAKGFQIVNGAQTVGALAAAEKHPSLLVQFRLIKAEDVKTDTGINRKIIQFNNTQNPVRVSDFRSNDSIQTWLESEFKAHRWSERSFKYSAKRGGILRGAIGLEELSKTIYAFYYEPTVIFASPKDLWTRRDEGGKYESCFGVDGRVVDSWDSERFLLLTFAVAALRELDLKIKQEIHDKPGADLTFLKRLRFHALGLLGQTCRNSGATKNLSDKDASGRVEKHWPDIKRVLIDQNYNYRKNNEMTLFAFVRNNEVWVGMKERILLY